MLRKNTAGQFVHWTGVNATTGAALTGATWTVRRCLDGTFAAATGSVTEDTGIGFYKFALSAADTNGNNVAIHATATNAVPVCLNMVTTACDPTSTAFGLVLAKTTNLTGLNDIAATDVVSSGAITTNAGAVSTVTTTTTATNVTTVNGLAANVITAASIATGAVDADALAADAGTEIAAAVWDMDATAHQTQGTFGQAIGDPVADANTIYKAVVTDATGATVGVDVVAVQADTDNIQTRIPAALTAGGNIKTEGLYMNGGVWLDTAAGAAGTTSYVNGTMTNPNSSMANARTIADAIKVKKFIVLNGSSLTLDQGYTNYTFTGERWTLALANRAIGGSHFAGAIVSGLSTGTGVEFDDCSIGTVTIANDFRAVACGLNGTFTVQAAGIFTFDQCFTDVAAGGNAVIDFAAVGATTIGFRHFAGTLAIANMAAGDVLVVAGTGKVTINNTCANASVHIRGTIELTNNGTAMTITDTARYSEDQNVASVTGSVGSIASAGITAASFAPGARAVVSGTADSGTTLTFVDAARTEADADYWKDMAVYFTSGTIAGQVRLITDFNPATDTFTFSPATTQAVGTNTYEILPNVASAGVTVPTASEVADAVWDEDATGHQTGGTFGQAIGDPAANTNTIYQAVVTDADGATVGVDTTAIKVATTSILLDTAEIGTAGAGLTNINLPNQTMDIVGNITGNLSGSVGSVTGAVGSVTGSVGSVTGAVGSVTGAVGSVTGLTAADVGAIKAKTDSLTFTVAGNVDANIQAVNDVTVTGDGQTGTEWGP